MANDIQPQLAYLISFIAILAKRAGGTLVIEGLKEFSGQQFQLDVKMDLDNDRVTIRTVDVIDGGANGNGHHAPNLQ